MNKRIFATTATALFSPSARAFILTFLCDDLTYRSRVENQLLLELQDNNKIDEHCDHFKICLQLMSPKDDAKDASRLALKCPYNMMIYKIEIQLHEIGLKQAGS